MFFRRFRTFGVDWTPLSENFFLYAKNFGAPLAPPRGLLGVPHLVYPSGIKSWLINDLYTKFGILFTIWSLHPKKALKGLHYKNIAV